jgi:hypothetical protein
MHLDVSLLRRARVENVERLAASLGVRLPRRPPTEGRYARSEYTNQLISNVMRELRRDALRAEFDRLAEL